jgi:putative ubiquitin-RnfH superfamily antitoxin RatB of RatAB toxin-antitoxin module
MLRIQVVYATPEKHISLSCHVPEGTTVQAALAQSSIAPYLPSNIDAYPVGIFGKIVPLAQILSDADRIEIYRPLQVDPKQARRAREEKNQKS